MPTKEQLIKALTDAFIKGRQTAYEESLSADMQKAEHYENFNAWADSMATKLLTDNKTNY